MKNTLVYLFIGIPLLGFSQAIRINQVGYYPESEKIAAAVDLRVSDGDIFTLVDVNTNEDVFTDTLKASRYYSAGEENVRLADFSAFETLGRYKIKIGAIESYPFEISNDAMLGVLKTSLRSYYYNRCSSGNLLKDTKFAGIWTRDGGHRDRTVYIHESAASVNWPVNRNYDPGSPRGWYDAGDYNKYIVSSGITTYTMLAMYERYSSILDTLNLNIPESSNNVPDILDEAIWNLRWMLTMQDPYDGGVFYKLTSLNFSPNNEMPKNDLTRRYVVMKSTTSTFDFTAVMAQASRIYKRFPGAFPGFADSCLTAAQKAWDWGLENQTVRYVQPADVSTGAYGDGNMNDERYWAAAELFISTEKDTLYSYINKDHHSNYLSWQDVYYLATFSLYHYRNKLNKDLTWVEERILNYADSWLNAYRSLPYKTPFGNRGDLFWGSSAVAGNIGLILAHAYDITKNEEYRDASLSCLDYMLGKNATGYSFMTGFGSKYPMNPHHRISLADGIVEPVPGMVVGGPNNKPDFENEGLLRSDYPLPPAKSYVDNYKSHSANEPAINYTIPFSYLALTAEARNKGVEAVVGIDDAQRSATKTVSMSVYPNPANGRARIFSDTKVLSAELLSLSGQVLLVVSSDEIDLSGVERGMYILSVKTEKGKVSSKLMVE